MEFHIFHHHDSDELREILRRIKLMAATLDDVVSKITNISNLEDALIASNKLLSDKLDAAIATGDMAKVQAIADALDADAAKLAAATVANTPAATPPAPAV